MHWKLLGRTPTTAPYKPDSKSNYIGFYLPQLVKISFFPSINEFRFESHLPKKKLSYVLV